MFAQNSAARPMDFGLGDHAVRFYEGDDELVDEVAEYLDDALRAGGLAIAIATPEHRRELSRRLCGIGGPMLDTSSDWFTGSLILLDAEQTMEKFMVGGRPDAQQFEATIAPLLAQAPPQKPVHAFGEMVALLCERGDYTGALILEGLWNDLARKHRFALFCAYAKDLFSSAEGAKAYRHVCSSHTRVLTELLKTAMAKEPGRALEDPPQHARELQAEIARRTQAEKTLRQRERELAAFLDNASEGIHKVAADGTILYANRAELDLLGYRWEEYVGHSIADFYVDRQQIQGILDKLKRGEVLRDEPALLRCRDGTHKPVLIYSNGHFEDGELKYTRCFTRDASERVAREQALEQRNSVIMQAPVGAALLTGPELRYELANDAYCAMLGCRGVVGKTFAECSPHLLGSELESMLVQGLRATGPLSAQELRAEMDAGGGGERFYSLSLQPVRAPGGQPQGVIAVMVDVSEQVLARRALETSVHERDHLVESLREASRVKDEFLAMLGHELRNPLSPIVTALRLMRMRGHQGLSRELDIMQRQVDHMVRLVDDLLDISRVTRGKIELKRERVELPAVVMKAAEQVNLLLEQRNHRLHLDVDPALRCEGDPVRLAQVVSNLLTNAARYTESGGDIWLRAWRDGEDHVAVSVRDNGRGIAPDILPQVFELFYQGQRSVDRSDGGLGVGLALVRSLVELHGGIVQAASAGLGQGSEFTFRLPRLDSGEDRAPQLPQSVPHGIAGLRRILVVDDNPDAVETLSSWLTAHGHEVAAYTDPVLALQDVARLRPHVAILDLGLPVMDGYELGSRIRDVLGWDCTLVALTGYGHEADRARSRAARFDHHLVKPVVPDALIAVLHADEEKGGTGGH